MMKTTLPAAINTVEEAKALLHSLHSNGEAFHPEDDAHDILWAGTSVTEEECDLLNKLMSDIYALPECTVKRNAEGETYMDFDPCGYYQEMEATQEMGVRESWLLGKCSQRIGLKL